MCFLIFGRTYSSVYLSVCVSPLTKMKNDRHLKFGTQTPLDYLFNFFYFRKNDPEDR